MTQEPTNWPTDWVREVVVPKSCIVRAPDGYTILRNGEDCGPEAEVSVGDLLRLQKNTAPDVAAEDDETPILEERRLRDVVCPQCQKPFELTWEGYGQKPVTLRLQGCPSGGIYDVSIACPHCDYVEEL